MSQNFLFLSFDYQETLVTPVQIQTKFNRSIEWNIRCWVPKACIHIYFTGLMSD